MQTARAMPNPKKRNPTLAHLRRVVTAYLEAPPVELTRYEYELEKFWRTHYRVDYDNGETLYFNTETLKPINRKETYEQQK